jgi:hypothetical protein
MDKPHTIADTHRYGGPNLRSALHADMGWCTVARADPGVQPAHAAVHQPLATPNPITSSPLLPSVLLSGEILFVEQEVGDVIAELADPQRVEASRQLWTTEHTEHTETRSCEPQSTPSRASQAGVRAAGKILAPRCQPPVHQPLRHLAARSSPHASAPLPCVPCIPWSCSSRLRAYPVWLRLCCAVCICVHLWFISAAALTSCWGMRRAETLKEIPR